jgi:hypothetical protein
VTRGWKNPSTSFPDFLSMSEHPGDTLGKRFLTFWGGLLAIFAVGAGLAVYHWIFLPDDDADPDPEGHKRRTEVLEKVTEEQDAAYNKVAEVEAGKTVALPPDRLLGWAAKQLAVQKAEPSKAKTPEAQLRDGAPPAAAPAPAPANPAAVPATGAAK